MTKISDNKIGKFRRSHPETSRKAAIAILPRSGSQRRKVFDLLARKPKGLTDEQMQFRLQLNPSSQRPRRIELVEAGLVRASNKRRMTASGSEAIVWKLTRKGKEAAGLK